MPNFYEKIFDEIHIQLSSIEFSELEKIKEEITIVKNASTKVLIGGNGGSHAIASHLSVDMTKICGVKALSLSDPALLSCLSNDFDYDLALSKFIEYFHQPGDLVILISSSGNSQNIINAASAAKLLGLRLVTLSGFSDQNELKKMGDVNIHVARNHYNIVENCQQIILTTVMDAIAENTI